MAIERKDEILEKALPTDNSAIPRYTGIDGNGGKVFEHVQLSLENTVLQEGTPINKALLSETLAASGVTTGSGNTFTLAQAGFVLVDGAEARIRLHANITAAAKLNIQNTGAKDLISSDGSPYLSGSSGAWLTVIYSQTLNKYIVQNGTGGVSSFKGRTGVVMPQAGDYTASQVTGAAMLDNNGLVEHASAYATPITATYKMLANTQVTAASGTSTARKVGFYTLPMTSYIFGDASIRCWETNFDINAPSGDYYHVWVASNILCQPSGGTGSKTAYIHKDTEQLHAAEYQAINTNHKMTLSIPETYIGKFKTGDMFGISIKGWAANDIISTGTTVNGNGTWISIKAIKAVP